MTIIERIEVIQSLADNMCAELSNLLKTPGIDAKKINEIIGMGVAISMNCREVYEEVENGK